MPKKYKVEMKVAARRHFQAGETLKNTHRKDVAGYLFGLAAECALKELMFASGMRPLPESRRWEDPFYAHFEGLKTMLRNSLSGRLSATLRRYVESSAFMQHWDITMRYSNGRNIQASWIDKWHQDSKDVIEVMDT